MSAGNKFIEDCERRMTPEQLRSPYSARSVHKLLGQLLDAVEQHANRIAAIEDRRIKYCGVHQRALTYGKGDVVTSGGGLWIALRETTGVPGKDAGWQLAVKGTR